MLLKLLLEETGIFFLKTDDEERRESLDTWGLESFQLSGTQGIT